MLQLIKKNLANTKNTKIKFLLNNFKKGNVTIITYISDFELNYIYYFGYNYWAKDQGLSRDGRIFDMYYETKFLTSIRLKCVE